MLRALLVATLCIPLLAPLGHAVDPTCVTVQAGDIYYICSDGTVWQETNGVPGLQRMAGCPESCYAADTQIV